jgi:hypothetical protein
MSKLSERFGKTWGDAARDVFLIVVSILIAFALDAWWDELKERQVQSEQIETLRSEFEAARDSLTSLSGYLDNAAQATNELLTLMGPEVTESDSERLFELLERSLNFGGAAPNYTALASVLAVGNRQIETSESLVDLLGNWPAQMEDIDGDFAHLDRNRDIELQAALVDAGIAGIAGIGGTPIVQKLGLPSPPFSVETDQLVQSVRVYAALSYRALRLNVLLLNVGMAVENADLIIAELARTARNSG